ncbi:unnamed protein product, partial [Sphagnum tenellum]
MEVSSNTTRVDDGGGHRHAGFAVQEESGHEIEEKNELLLKALTVEREAQAALYHELEKERNAAATAANEAMAMITRLQEEKALVQMEARQYQRMVEEKTMYDQEAMEVLKEVIARHEEEKNELEEEIRICKRKLRLWESRSKMRTQEGRTGSSESSRKVISRIVEEEDNALCQWLFQEGVVMGRNHLDPSSSLMERGDNSGTGKLEEESESQGMDDESLGLMMGGEHAEEEECGEEEELFIQDIYEVHNAPHQPRGVVLQEDTWDSQEWNSEIRHLSNSDRLGKPDLLILHEEEETPEDGVGEGTYYPERRNNEVPSKDEVGSSGIDRQWEGFCDDNIRSNSSTISRDSACRVPVEDEVMHLTLRLKALEADRNLMKQTIESLRRENGEMKLLQEIAQQLRELRGLEQKDLQQQSKPLP